MVEITSNKNEYAGMYMNMPVKIIFYNCCYPYMYMPASSL